MDDKLFGELLESVSEAGEIRRADQPPNHLKFPIGTIISCPDCGRRIATAVNDVFACSVISSKDWEGIEPFSIMVCSSDNVPYFSEGKLHTTEGWK
jgi:hypothetical protein